MFQNSTVLAIIIKFTRNNYSFLIHYDQNIFKIALYTVYYNLIYHWKSIWKEQMPIIIIASYKKKCI